jgi:hypothetical protein
MNDPISEFTVQARDYCALIEDGPAPNSWMFAQACLMQLLLLYQLALQLPHAGPDSDDLLPRIEYETWNLVREKIAKRLARDYYWAVFEPLEQELPEAIAGSLSDDLADIWRDLKPGLDVIDAGTTTSPNDLAWEWRVSFETHWGAHAVGAIAALHALCFGPYADGNRHTLAPPSR